ncbi:DinB family protein [Algoriphagus sp. NG3]|uniref:DinB family protein n=1 Tax=Algoriphagus sp. NG3 TaxID=3097546 RepID=UPI002A82E688|nr:hypothetical protein [Algoriphagus sp. NG3]WPR76202.1 hypothetical protein SLW71_02435 [Algoriphagus sp. NG3]
MDISQLFKDSFDTFKVFDNLTIEQASQTSENTPKTVLQILNHLTIWQDYQLRLLRNGFLNQSINEIDTWTEEKSVLSQELLDEKVNEFKRQIDSIKSEVNNFDKANGGYEIKIKTIQDLALHLSFHLGEIISLRRIQRNYPWPNEMKEFLR